LIRRGGFLPGAAALLARGGVGATAPASILKKWPAPPIIMIGHPNLQKNWSPPSRHLPLYKKTGRTDRSRESVGVASFVPVS